MRYANGEIGIDMELKKDYPSFIIVENPIIKRTLVEDIWKQTKGLEGSSIISEKGRELLFTKHIELVLNPLNIDFNSRKIKTKLLQESKEILMEFEQHLFISVKTKTMELFEKIIEKMPYPLEYKTQIDPEDYLKIGDIHIVPEETDFLERLISYMKIMQQACNVKVFILVDLYDYLERSELMEIIKSSIYCDITLLFIESKECGNLEKKYTTIIDSDCCVIQY